MAEWLTSQWLIYLRAVIVLSISHKSFHGNQTGLVFLPLKLVLFWCQLLNYLLVTTMSSLSNPVGFVATFSGRNREGFVCLVVNLDTTRVDWSKL